MTLEANDLAHFASMQTVALLDWRVALRTMARGFDSFA